MLVTLSGASTWPDSLTWEPVIGVGEDRGSVLLRNDADKIERRIVDDLPDLGSARDPLVGHLRQARGDPEPVVVRRDDKGLFFLLEPVELVLDARHGALDGRKVRHGLCESALSRTVFDSSMWAWISRTRGVQLRIGQLHERLSRVDPGIRGREDLDDETRDPVHNVPLHRGLEDAGAPETRWAPAPRRGAPPRPPRPPRKPPPRGSRFLSSRGSAAR